MKANESSKRRHAGLHLILMLAFTTALVGALPSSAAAGSPPQDPPPPIKEDWAQCFGENAQIGMHAQTGKLRFVQAEAGKPIQQSEKGLQFSTAEEAARGYLSDCGTLFGLDTQQDDLAVMRLREAEDGRTIIRFQQMHLDIPVFAGELMVHVTAENAIAAVTGELLPDITVDTQPVISPEQAQSAAYLAAGGTPESDALPLEVSEPELWIYSPNLVEPQPGPTALVWRMEVTAGDEAPIRYLVLINAADGSVVLSINQTDTAKNRKTYTALNGTTRPGTLVCNEANPNCTGSPYSDTDAINAHMFAGEAYDFYFNNYGRDSLDNAGMTLISTVHYSTGWCNASWNGIQMTYGDGCFIVVDDVVGHELTHGVTEHESNLVYAFESGAINESFSDVWGEFVDLSYSTGGGDDSLPARWYMGEDVEGGAIRYMQNPPAFGDPDRMGSPNYYTGLNDNGGVHTNSGVNNKAAYLMTDGASFNGYTITGLGIPKVGHIYYEVQINWLTTGSDYVDLGNALYGACTSLIGSYGISAPDCTQVQNVTYATEMIATTAPSNDDFNTPWVVGSTPYTGVAQGITYATTAVDDPPFACVSGPKSKSVWYRYTPATSGDLAINTADSDYDTVLAVWTGSRGSLTSVACNDDYSSLQSQVTFAATGGTTYYIEVASFSGLGGTLQLDVRAGPPANDDFNTPVVIGGLPYTGPSLDTTGATTSGDDPLLTCYGDEHYQTVWYDYTASANSTVTVDTLGSDYDTMLAVWTGSRGSLISLGCNDDYGGAYTSRVAFAATSGTTYHIEAVSWDDGGGHLTLHAATTGGPTNWQTMAPMSIARSRPSVAAANGRVFVLGGESSSTALPVKGSQPGMLFEGWEQPAWETSVEAYNPATNGWSSVAAKPTGVSNTGAATIDNWIYVPGGYNGTSLVSVLEAYDAVGNGWWSGPSMPVAQYGHAVVALNDRLYVLGGYNGSSVMNTCHMYDVNTEMWTTCAPMTYARNFPGAGVVNGKIYVVGGVNGSLVDTNVVEEYDPGTDSWTTKASMGAARGGPGVTGYGNTLYVCGGGWTSYLDSCEKYTPSTNTWSSFDHLNTGRRTLGMAQLNGVLYAEAGYAGAFLAVNERYAGLPAFYTISGNAFTTGVTITYTGGTTGVDPNADYSFSVASGSNVTVTPSKAGCTFTPTSRSYSNVLANLPGEDYAATCVGNDAPVITEGASVSTATTETGFPNPLDLTLHATDEDLNTLTWSIGTPPAHGTISLSGTGSSKAIPYFPVAGYNGMDSFVVVVSDGAGGSDSIVINLTVRHVTPQSPHALSAAAILRAEAESLTAQEAPIDTPSSEAETGGTSIVPLPTATVTPGALHSLPHPGLFKMLMGARP